MKNERLRLPVFVHSLNKEVLSTPLAETQAWANHGFNPIAEYLQKERTPTSALLDFLELSLRHSRAPNTDNDFVDAVNRVLEEYDAPYLLTRYAFEEEPIQGGRGATIDIADSARSGACEIIVSRP